MNVSLSRWKVSRNVALIKQIKHVLSVLQTK